MTILSEKVDQLFLTFTTSKNSTEITEKIEQTSLAAYEFRPRKYYRNDLIKRMKIDFGKETLISDIRFEIDQKPDPIQILKNVSKILTPYIHPVKNRTETLCNVDDRINLFKPATALVISEFRNVFI